MLEGHRRDQTTGYVQFPTCHSPFALQLFFKVVDSNFPASFRRGLIRSRRLHRADRRSEEHTSALQSLMRISYAVFCLKKKNQHHHVNECMTNNNNSNRYHNMAL